MSLTPDLFFRIDPGQPLSYDMVLTHEAYHLSFRSQAMIGQLLMRVKPQSFPDVALPTLLLNP
jgi:hypothetical protein